MVIIRKIAIYDEDTDYALSLAEYISEYRTREYRVYAFSDRNKLEEFIKSEKIDALISDEATIDSLRGLVDVWDIRHSIVLSGDKEEKFLDKTSIYKYQAAEIILDDMDKIFEDEVKDIIKEESKEAKCKDFNVMMLVAPAYPTDVCNVALGICNYYEDEYLIADCSLMSAIFDNVQEKYMSQAIYLLENGLDNIADFEECVCKRNRISYITGINDCSDICQICEIGFEKLCNKIKELGYKGLILVCDINSAIALCGYVEKESIVVLEGKGKKIRDYTYNLLREMNCIGDKRVRLINTDSIRDKYLNQAIDFDEAYEKGGLYKLVNEICK